MEAENGSKAGADVYEAALSGATAERGWLAYRTAHRVLESGDREGAARHAEIALSEPLNSPARAACHELVGDAAAAAGDVPKAERHYVLSHFEDNLRASAWNSLRALLAASGAPEANEMYFPFLGIPESVIQRACPGAEGRCVPRKPPPWPLFRFPNARTFGCAEPRGVPPFPYSVEERVRTSTTVDDLLVWALEGTRLLHHFGSVHVVHEGRLIAPLATGDLPFERFDRRPPKRVAGTVGLIADIFYTPNYAHWLLDALPRIHVLRTAWQEPIDFFYGSFSGCPYQAEHLRALGVRPDQLLSAADFPCIEPDRLLVSMASFSIHHPAQGAAPWALRFIRQTVLPNPPARSEKKLFVSRKDGMARRIRDEDALFDVLRTRYGFERMLLSEHSAPEQARRFAEAAVVVAAHGAGNANFVFLSPGAKVFEIFCPLYGTSAFFQIAQAVGAEYYAVDGDDALRVPARELTGQFENPHGSRDVAIGVERLSRILDEAGV